MLKSRGWCNEIGSMACSQVMVEEQEVEPGLAARIDPAYVIHFRPVQISAFSPLIALVLEIRTFKVVTDFNLYNSTYIMTLKCSNN